MKIVKSWVLLITSFALLISCDSKTKNYLITASMGQKGVDAGMEILSKEGSAVDAALSVALSEIAETGGKHVSFAGAINLIYYEKETGKVHNMNAAFNTVQNETDPLTIPSVTYNLSDITRILVDGRTIMVPGFMKGLEEAHKKFGKIPYKELFDNAIKVAEVGREWTNEDNSNFLQWKNILSKYPETKAIFTKSDGSFYNVGDTFKQPILAQTLKKISNEGSNYMYKGEWGKKFVNSARNIGSKITMKDLQDYEVIWTNPIQGKYNGYDIYLNGEPDFGAYRLIEALNIAEEVRLSDMGYYYKSPLAMATIYQILAASLYSSNLPSFFGDSLDLSRITRLKKETSLKMWEAWKKINKINTLNIPKNKNEHTSAIVSIDKLGNIAVVTHTIKTANWGSTGLFIDGISIPDPASFEQNRIYSTGPGKRLPEEIVPGIIIKDGKPVLGFSCISGGALNQTFISLINVLDFKMTPQQSVENPGIGDFAFVQDKLSLTIEPKTFIDSLIISATEFDAHFNESLSVKSVFWTGVSIDENNGRLQGTNVWLK